MTTDDAQPDPSELLRLLGGGLDLPNAAARVGLTTEAALALLRAATAVEPPPDVARVIELAHLDVLRRSLLPRLLAESDPQAAWALLEIHRARSALLGLNADAAGITPPPNELDLIRQRRAARRGGLGDG